MPSRWTDHRAQARTSGITLIEVVMAILVLAVAIPPVAGLYREVSAQSVDHTLQTVATVYADALMHEIVSKSFEDPDVAAGSFGTEESNRSAYDDIDDFDGMSHSPPERMNGVQLDEYAGLTRSVTVHNVKANDPDPTTPQADGSTNMKRITVTVAWKGGRGGEITLATLRSKLASS